MTLPIDLASRFPPIAFGFGLREEPGFTPPPGIVRLRGKERVDINVAVGAHYFFTCLSDRQPTFGMVEDFVTGSTTVVGGLHVFRGRGHSDDSEFNRSLSQVHSKFVGIGFMSEHAGATWFTSMESLWGRDSAWVRGAVRFEKEDSKEHGPDYIAAPFDPTATDAPDPIFVLEFKGRVARVDFHSPAFDGWRAQAKNIQCLLGPRRMPQKLKAWVLGFNYAFESGANCRPHSTLLVDDPLVGSPDDPTPERTHATIEPIVRDHLARQCSRLGAGRLAPSIVYGGEAAPPRALPPIYSVRHPQLGARRYIGWFASWGPDGDLIWASAPRSWPSATEVDIELASDRGWAHVHIRSRGRVDAFAEVHVHGGVPSGSRRELERFVRRILRGDDRELFIGQDANMLREAIGTTPGRGLDGAPFRDPIQFSTTGGEGDTPYAVQVLRNGGLVADARAVDPVDDAEWWTNRQ